MSKLSARVKTRRIERTIFILRCLNIRTLWKLETIMLHIKWELCEEQGVDMHINKDGDAQLFMQRALLYFVHGS